MSDILPVCSSHLSIYLSKIFRVGPWPHFQGHQWSLLLPSKVCCCLETAQTWNLLIKIIISITNMIIWWLPLSQFQNCCSVKHNNSKMELVLISLQGYRNTTRTCVSPLFVLNVWQSVIFMTMVYAIVNGLKLAWK